MNVNLDKPTAEVGAQPYPNGRWTPRQSSLQRLSELHTSSCRSFWQQWQSASVQGEVLADESGDGDDKQCSGEPGQLEVFAEHG